MSARVDREIAELLDEAERDNKCLVCQSSGLRRALDRRRHGGELISPWPALYARAACWERLRPDERARWVLRGLHDLHPSWVFCGPSAAALQGLSVSWSLLSTVHVAVPPGSAGHSSSRLVRHPVRDLDPELAGGVPVTALPRTVFDCARWLSFREGLAVADSALRVGRIPQEELVAYVGQMHGGYHGIEQARVTVTHADGRSENGGESKARAAMWELGFATPDLQVEVPNPFSGGGVYRVDFRWLLPDGTEVYGEHDGGVKYVDPQMNGGSPLEALKSERTRESRLTVTHASIVRFSPADVANAEFFDWLLRLYGVPKDHDPLIGLSAAGGVAVPEPPEIELVPVEAYGLDVLVAGNSGGENGRFEATLARKTSACST